jgi:hypothetical protein
MKSNAGISRRSDRQLPLIPYNESADHGVPVALSLWSDQFSAVMMFSCG